MKTWMSVLVLLLFSFQVKAAPGTSSSFVNSISLVGGAGSVANDDKTIPNTSLLYGELLLNSAYNFGMIGLAVQASYRYVGQTSEPDSVGGMNMAGSGYLVGAGLLFDFGNFKITAIYDLLGAYDFSKSSSSGDKVKYGAPSGFHLNLGYIWKPNWQMLLSLSQVGYKERTVNSATSDISANPVTYMLYGAGIGYMF